MKKCTKAYIQGFMDKCASANIDPELLIKQAGGYYMKGSTLIYNADPDFKGDPKVNAAMARINVSNKKYKPEKEENDKEDKQAKQAQLSQDSSGAYNLKITPEVQDIVKRFGLAAGASLVPNALFNLMRGERLTANALPVAAVSGGAYAAWPQMGSKLKELQSNYMQRYNK